MANEIISYLEMCQREGSSLQRGMNYRLGGSHSVFLMSVRPGAPYADRLADDGSTLIYEGHDASRTAEVADPKLVDQPEFTASGKLTQNGRFHQAAQLHKSGVRPAERIRVYEKIKQGIWSYNGIFYLEDSWREESNGRRVFKFRLVSIEEENESSTPAVLHAKNRRIIPTAVKLDVWARDGASVLRAGPRATFTLIILSRGPKAALPTQLIISSCFVAATTCRSITG